MKALTIRQPHASLVAVGAKTIETRGWPTKYRGTLLIHAGKARPVNSAHRLLDIGDWRTYWTGNRDPVRMYERARYGEEVATVLPLGAVVASCQLIDCVPIKPWTEASWTETYLTVDNKGGLTLANPRNDDTRSGWREFDDQLPFGDFSPGRYAWLLEDIKPTTEPIPCRGKQGLWVPPPEVVERIA